MIKRIGTQLRRLTHRLPGKSSAPVPPPTADDEYASFLAAGNPPWKPGYERHKIRCITTALADPAFDPDYLPPSYGWRLDERIVEYPWLFNRLPTGPGRLLDAGSILNHPYILPHQKLQEKNCFISTLAPEGWSAWNLGVSYVFEDLRETCFRDKYFDFIVCVSTLEHVGMDNSYLYTKDKKKSEKCTSDFIKCLEELRRTLKENGKILLTVPYGIYQDHGWFQVFDQDLLDTAINAFAPTQVREWIYRYLPDGWVRSDRQAAASALYFDIHTAKDYDPDYAAASRAIACLEMTR